MRARMRVPALGFFLLAVAIAETIYATTARANAVQMQSGCIGTVAPWVGYMGDFKTIVSGTDSANTSYRTLWHLPQLSADSVSLVTDSATCARAALAYGRNLDVPDTLTARQMVTIRVGPTRYVVGDPNYGSSYMLVMVFDSSFDTVFVSVAH